MSNKKFPALLSQPSMMDDNPVVLESTTKSLPTPDIVPESQTTTPSRPRHVHLELIYVLTLNDFAAADKYIKELIETDPTIINDPTYIESVANHIDLQREFISEQGGKLPTVFNPSEAIIKWFVDHKFPVGRSANFMIQNLYKLSILQPLAFTSSASVIQAERYTGTSTQQTKIFVEKYTIYNSVFDIIMSKTKLEDIDSSIFAHLYEYAPIVLEKLIGLGLNITDKVDDKPIAWHIMRIAEKPNILFGRTSLAFAFYNLLRNSKFYTPNPYYFVGCQSTEIIQNLIENPLFVEQMKIPLTEINPPRYLIETIADDRIHSLLRNRGSPDPSKGIFDELILDKLANFKITITNNLASINTRNSQDMNIMAFSLMNGPYTTAHLTCLQALVVQAGGGIFSDYIANPPLQPNRFLNWKALHIAFHRFDLGAWKIQKKIDDNEKRRRQMQIAGNSQELPVSETHIVRNNIDDMHDSKSSKQVDIINWLYQQAEVFQVFGLDRYERSPLMCLPIDEEWINEATGVDHARDIIDLFVSKEIQFLNKNRSGKLPLDPISFATNILLWRREEMKARKSSIIIRYMHVDAPTLASSFYSRKQL
jgi:hypothetical protein